MAKKEKKEDYFHWTPKEKARLKALTNERLGRGVDEVLAIRHSIRDLLLDRISEREMGKKTKKKD
jgi:hypothetical protein